jgi:hypothetical protein
MDAAVANRSRKRLIRRSEPGHAPNSRFEERARCAFFNDLLAIGGIGAPAFV